MDEDRLRQLTINTFNTTLPYFANTLPPLDTTPFFLFVFIPKLSALIITTVSIKLKKNRVCSSKASGWITIYLENFNKASILFLTLIGLRCVSVCVQLKYVHQRKHAMFTMKSPIFLLRCCLLKCSGTNTQDTHKILHDVYLALSGLNLVFYYKGKLISFVPDALFKPFTEL